MGDVKAVNLESGKLASQILLGVAVSDAVH